MGKMEFLKKLITDPATRLYFLSAHGFYHSLSDEEYLKRLWKYQMGTELNLDNPSTICEKLQWLKVYYHNPQYTKLADKYEIKKIVADKIGEDHVIPLLGVWNSFDEIDFTTLPNQFVLKATHDSGSYMVCKNKETFDYKYARKMFNKALKRNYYWSGREWQYKDIPPRIIAEQYMDTLGHPDSVEYKLTCMDGEVKFSTVCTGIAHAGFEDRTNDHFDSEFKHMPWYSYYKNSTKPIELPEQIHEMIEYAELLSKDIPYVRVDFYLIDGKVYFGEMTFHTWNGFIEFTPPEWDNILGEMLKLPDIKEE